MTDDRTPESLAVGRNEPDIFDFRLNSARGNLEALGRFVESIRSRNRSLRNLKHRLVDDGYLIDDGLKRLKQQITSIRDSAQYKAPNPGDINAAVDRAQEHLGNLEMAFIAAQTTANEITVLQLDQSAMTPSEAEFTKKIKVSQSKLVNIETGSDRDEVKPWPELSGLGALWVEYLDYLAGLSLRHDGLDNGVCGIADDLIRELYVQFEALAALAIPGRDSCVGTIPKIVYLRFPEWTVWSLPLVAHELWHIAESADPPAPISSNFYGRAKTLLERNGTFPAGPDGAKTCLRWIEDPEHPERRQELRHYLADAFATYTMGPAYAWSTVFLALNPLLANDQRRAQIILNVLDRLSEGDSLRSFVGVRRQLARIWNRALEEAGRAPETLPDDLSKWVDTFIDYLATIADLKFPTKLWAPGRTAWVAAFLDGDDPTAGKAGAQVDSPALSIRFALTAAWEARIQRPEASAEIAARCFKKCKMPGAAPVEVPAKPDTSSGQWVNLAR